MKGLKNRICGLFFYFLIFTPFSGIIAQDAKNVRVSGVVVTSEKIPIEYATVFLLDRNDSTFVEGAVTDEKGCFEIKNIPSGAYFLSIDHILYESKFVSVEKDFKGLDTIVMTLRINMLKEVVVTSNFITRKPDGYVVALKNNPVSKGKSVEQVLDLLPMVTVRNGISINGMEGTQVYVNNRRIRDLQELRELDAVNVDQAEVLLHAGSSYDARSKGGVINIKLAKVPEGGLYGSFGGGLGVRPEYGVASDYVNSVFNYRYKKINLYNFIRYSDFKDIYSNEVVNYYPDLNTRIDMATNEKGWSRALHENLSLLYEISEKQNIGGNFSMKLNGSKPLGSSNSDKYVDGVRTGNSSSSIRSDTDNDEYQAALNYNWVLNDKGSNVKIITDYLRHNNGLKAYERYMYDGNKNYKRSDQRNGTDMFEADAKFELKTGGASEWQTGLRYYSVHTVRALRYDDYEDNVWVNDEKNSDHFSLKGTGYAAYVSFKSTVDKFSYNLGLRGQVDNINHHSYNSGNRVRKQYKNLFPSVNVGYTFDSMRMFAVDLSYLRGIGYIPYSEISPAIKYETEYSYTKGNPDLSVSFDNTIQFVCSYKKWSLFYDYYRMRNDIHYLTFLDKENPLVTYSMPENTGVKRLHVVGFDGSIKIMKRWNLYVSGYVRHRLSRYKEFKEEKEYGSTAFFTRIYNDFDFNDRWGGVFLGFTYETREKVDDKTMFPAYGISIGVHKYFFNKKILVRLQSQPLFSKLRRYEINKDDLYSVNRFKTSQTNFSLSVSYNFRLGKRVEVKQTEKVQTVETREERK